MGLCTTCRKNETAIECGVCLEPACKECACFLEEEAFALLPVRPADLEHNTYCPTCYANKVLPELEVYEEGVKKAEQINVYFKDQSKETRLIPRLAKPIKIERCEDRQEMIMRLAYQAAQAGFNAIIDVDLVATKARLGGRYRAFVWRGSATPANLNAKQLRIGQKP